MHIWNISVNCTYTTNLKVWGRQVFLFIFESLLCSTRLHLFDQKLSKNNNTVNFLIYILQSWIFSIITSVYNVTWSLRNNYNILNWCLRNISYYYQCWNKFLLINIFVKTMIHFYLLCIKSSKEKHWSEIEIFCNTVNVFTVPFDQFNAPLLNKKQLPDHSIFEGWLLNVFLTLSPVSHRSLIWWRVCDALPFLWCVNALLKFSTGTGLLARHLKKMAHLTNEKLLKMMMMTKVNQMKTQKVTFHNLVIHLMFSA